MKIISTLACALLLTGHAFAENNPGAHFIKSWDGDGDGLVTLDEIFAKRDNVFASFDSDENGALDSEEYAFFDQARANDQENHGKGEGEGKLHQAMSLAFNDLNEDGNVSRAEFLIQSGAMLAIADKNGDGVISSDDFGNH